MEKTKIYAIIVSIILVMVLGLLFQGWLDTQRETARIEQERVLQEKYDEGLEKGMKEVNDNWDDIFLFLIRENKVFIKEIVKDNTTTTIFIGAKIQANE